MPRPRPAAGPPPAGGMTTTGLPASGAAPTPSSGGASTGADPSAVGGDAARMVLTQALLASVQPGTATGGTSPGQNGGTATTPPGTNPTASTAPGPKTTAAAPVPTPALVAGGNPLGQATSLKAKPGGAPDLKAHLPPKTTWVTGTSSLVAGAAAAPGAGQPAAPTTAAELVAAPTVPEPGPLAVLGLAAVLEGLRRLGRRAGCGWA